MTDDRLLRRETTPAARFALPDEIGVIAALVAMMVIVGVARPRFLNPINLFALLGNTTFLGMLALGMVFLLAIREIDLSVGWMFNFSAVIAAMLMVAGFNPWLAAVAGIGFGAGLGLVNGILVVGLRLPAVIVTLGTYSMFQGLSLVANQGRAIVPGDTSQQLLSASSRPSCSACCRSPRWCSSCWPSSCMSCCTAPASAIACRRSAAIRKRRASPAFRPAACGCRRW